MLRPAIVARRADDNGAVIANSEIGISAVVFNERSGKLRFQSMKVHHLFNWQTSSVVSASPLTIQLVCISKLIKVNISVM